MSRPSTQSAIALSNASHRHMYMHLSIGIPCLLRHRTALSNPLAIHSKQHSHNTEDRRYACEDEPTKIVSKVSTMIMKGLTYIA